MTLLLVSMRLNVWGGDKSIESSVCATAALEVDELVYTYIYVTPLPFNFAQYQFHSSTCYCVVMTIY